MSETKKSGSNIAFIGLFVTIAMSLFTVFIATSQKRKNDKEAKTEKASVAPASIDKNPEAVLGYQVGDQADDFSLKSTEGKQVALKDYKDAKGYLVIFTCNHCPYAKMYEDRIIELHKTFEAQGYPVVAINPNDPTIQPDDSFDKMQERAKEKSFKFAYLFDETQETARKFGATKTPHVFLLDKERKVRYIGAIDDNAQDASQASKFYVADAIKELLKGATVSVNNTKAVGCSIKWKQ
ncbi:MAG: thioredoxin family protein [Bacteroidetes bacterium]|nr:MAG: thioredoxin family protein [Bacteroidota bacterium]